MGHVGRPPTAPLYQLRPDRRQSVSLHRVLRDLVQVYRSSSGPAAHNFTCPQTVRSKGVTHYAAFKTRSHVLL